MADGRAAALAGLVAVDAAGAGLAFRHGIAGEPLGFGGTLDVRRPAVLLLWGSGLCAPLAALLAAPLLLRRSPRLLRVLGALFAIGALIEPVLWGRRPCPRYARLLLTLHVVLGATLAAMPTGDDALSS